MINQNDTFRSYVGKIKDIYDNWEKITAENTEMTLTPTRKGKMGLELKGNTFQKTTTGKNMYDNSQNSNLWISQNGSITTFSGSNVRRYTAVPNQDITLSAKFSNPSSNAIIVIAFYDIDDNLLGRYVRVNQSIMTLTQTTPANASYYYAGRYWVTPDEIMLEKSSSATPYEPFTNGASPNPEFSQNIEVVTGDNEIIVSNKNWLNKDNYINDSWESSKNGWVLNLKAGTYTLSANTKLHMVKGSEHMSTGWGNAKFGTGNANANSYTFTIAEDFNQYLWITVDTNNTTVDVNKDNISNFDIQLEKGSSATSFVEHKEQVFPISLGNMEMCSIGDYDDYFQIENDKWYKYGTLKKIINPISNQFDGVQVSSGWYRIPMPLSDMKNEGSSRHANILCNKYKANINNNFNICFSYDDYVYFYLSEGMTTKEQFMTTVNDFILYYPLSTPEITEITDTTLIEQLNDIYENAKSYQEQTNIAQTNDNLPFIISASALKKGGI